MKNLLILLSLLALIPPIISQQTFLGVQSNIVHPKKASQLNFPPYGAYITKVVQNSPAEQAGLQPFDYIYQIGETTFENGHDFNRSVKNGQLANSTAVYFIRDGKKMEAMTNLISYDQRPQSPEITETEDPFLGIHSTHDNDQNLPGIQVNIGDNTAADYIGIEDGDRITYIDNYPIIDWHDAAAAINNRQVGDNIEVTVLRNGEFMTLNGRIKSEDGNTPIDLEIDMENMEVIVTPMPEEEMSEEINNVLSEEMPVFSANLNVFPNPSIGRFTIDLESTSAAPVTLQIFDSQGKNIINQNIVGSNNRYRENIDLGTNPAGIYYLKVVQADQVMTRKMIVTRS